MSVFQKRIMRGVTAGATTLALVFQPQMLVAGQPLITTPAPVKTVTTKIPVRHEQVPAPRDVVLEGQGVLRGQIVNAQGLAVVNTPVSLQTGGKEVARVLTDKTGNFQAAGLKGGVYQVASNGHQGVYRLWAPRTAPPAATQGLRIVSQPADVVRGQLGPGGGPFATVGQWIAEHPIMTAGAVAAAVAIPIAIDDDDDPATP